MAPKDYVHKLLCFADYRSRLRKVNRKQLIKAMNLSKRKEEDDIKKHFDANVLKPEQELTVSKSKLKQKSYGALKLENRIFKIKKSLASASLTDSNLNGRPDDSSYSEIVANRSEICPRNVAENEELSKPKCALTMRRPAISKKIVAPTRKRAETGDGSVQNVLHNKEYTFREEEGETSGFMKKPILKQGNYTKIVTLKKKTWLKPEAAVELSSFPFSNQIPGKRNNTGMLQKVKKEECKNEIDHIYKINDVSRSMRVKQGYQSSSSTGFYRYSVNPEEHVKETKVCKSDGSDDDTRTIDVQERIKTEQDEDAKVESLPLLEQKRQVKKRVPKYKYDGYKTDRVPHGLQPQVTALPAQPGESLPELQPHESKSANLSWIGSENGRCDSKYRLRKVVKREGRYLALPQITPTLTIDGPKDHYRNRRNNYRVGQLQYEGRKEIAFINFNNL